MPDQRLSGFALILGAIASIITMALHPTAKHAMTPDALHSMMHLSVAVHGLALLSLPITFIGAMGLTQRLASAGSVGVCALVLQGFADIAVMNAAVMSGLVAPSVADQIQNDGAGVEMWSALLHYTGDLNQGFAMVFVVASSLAIFLWSIAVLKTSFPARGAAYCGYFIAPITLVAVLSGHIRLNVHGFGAIVLAQAIWLVWIGVQLVRTGADAK